MDPCETHVLGHLLLSNLTSLGDLVKMQILGKSLAVQWLGLTCFHCRGPRFSPWLGIQKSHRPLGMAKLMQILVQLVWGWV